MLKRVVYGYFEPYLTHISPCEFRKTVEMGNFRTDGAYTGGSGGTC